MRDDTPAELMTMREYFAAAALQGMLASGRIDYTAPEIATRAYDLANAMVQAGQGE